MIPSKFVFLSYTIKISIVLYITYHSPIPSPRTPPTPKISLIYHPSEDNTAAAHAPCGGFTTAAGGTLEEVGLMGGSVEGGQKQTRLTPRY